VRVARFPAPVSEVSGGAKPWVRRVVCRSLLCDFRYRRGVAIYLLKSRPLPWQWIYRHQTMPVSRPAMHRSWRPNAATARRASAGFRPVLRSAATDRRTANRMVILERRDQRSRRPLSFRMKQGAYLAHHSFQVSPAQYPRPVCSRKVMLGPGFHVSSWMVTRASGGSRTFRWRASRCFRCRRPRLRRPTPRRPKALRPSLR
jgi:hypothetical protein